MRILQGPARHFVVQANITQRGEGARQIHRSHGVWHFSGPADRASAVIEVAVDDENSLLTRDGPARIAHVAFLRRAESMDSAESGMSPSVARLPGAAWPGF